MAFINGRYYSSTGRYSPYVSIQIQRYKSAQSNQKFLEQTSAAVGAFAAASTNLVSGMGDIAARIASKRIQSERAAQSNNALDIASLLDTLA
jgi:hypothetical protein